LVIDDDPMMRTLMARLLEALGHEPILAESAAEGLAKFEASQPLLVITDLNMPGGDGGDTVVATIRGSGREVRILAVSGAVADGLGDAHAGLAVDGVLGKPFRAMEFTDAIDRMLPGN
jgi:CheY-like chemotaxis protein